MVVSALILALRASPAIAKKTAYAGPIIGADQRPGSSVSFKVDSRRKGGTFRPVAVIKFKSAFLIASCSQGPLGSSTASGLPTVGVRKRQFSNQLVDANSSGTLTYDVSGRIPRKGPAEGTIRVTGSYTLPDTGTSFCDATVPWTASKVDPDQYAG